jgi:hypothetical protein
MIESMACGTPVIAWQRGSVPEVIEDGVSGYIVRSEEQALAAIGRISALDRRRVRASFERRFTATIMARRYVNIYTRLLTRRLRFEQEKRNALPRSGTGWRIVNRQTKPAELTVHDRRELGDRDSS